MHLIALLNQNGGIGKTTLAVHLAAWLAERGFNVAVLDCDPQASTQRWLAKAAPGVAVFTPQTPREIAERAEFCRPHLDVLVADSKPGLDPAALALAKLADRLLMPIVPSFINIDGSTQAVTALDKMGAFKGRDQNFAWAVMNLVDESAAATNRVRFRMKMLGVRAAEHCIGRRQIFRSAYENGAVAWRMRQINPGFTQAARLASAELDKVFAEVLPDELSRQTDDCGPGKAARGDRGHDAVAGERGIAPAEPATGSGDGEAARVA